ncbi:MAG: PQQ-binding-like beta-propeller repeat protein, partial [Nannocystaceae bacterium]
MMRKSLRLPVLLAVIGVLALGWWLAKPKTRFTYGLQPVSQHSAILLTRHNSRDATYFWVEHVADDGKLLWSREVSPFRPADALEFSGIAATEDRVVLLGKGPDGTGKAMALATTTGELLWETVLGSDPFSARIGRMLILDNSRVYVFFDQIVDEEEVVNSVCAVSLSNGQVLWSRTIEDASPGYKPIVLAPDRLVVPKSNHQYTEVDGATGKELRDLPIERVGCEIPEGLLGYAGQELIPISRAGVPTHIALPDKAHGTWRGPCGVHRTPEASDDYVIGIQGKTASMIKFPASGGSPVWQLDLGTTNFEDSASQMGVLPRFLPVIVTTAEGNDVLVVDLDRGNLVSREPIPLGSSVFVGPER